MNWRRGRTYLPLVVGLPLVLGACSTSPESLEQIVEDEPGVIEVDASENEGDDLVPGMRIPKHVNILMDAEASATQVMSVFDALAGDVDDGDVDEIEVVLDDPKRATLATGAGVHATDVMVEELVEAACDDRIIKYRREAYPTLPGVSITLGPADFDDVVSVADRYREVDEIEFVEVVSGGIVLIRDEVNEDPSFTGARERFVHAVSRRFRLTGAVVSGRGSLDLAVAPADSAALLRYVDAHAAEKTLGRIVVRTKR